MEPLNGLKVRWHHNVLPAHGQTRTAVIRWRLIGLGIAVAIIAFACGFTLRGILKLGPRSVTSASSVKSPSMVARNTGVLSETNDVNTSVQSDSIAVDVHGDVIHPGVYHLPVSSRLQDAIQLAGGFKHAKDADAVNLASILDDGQEVVVPNADSPAASGTTDKGAGKVRNNQDASNSMSTSEAQVAESGVNPVDLNTADVATLETLPGIGPGRATAIVNYRKAHGPFADVADIQKVKGIGSGIFHRIEPYLLTGP